MKLKAMGKINLALDVVRKREDGYHEVRMIMQTVQIYDLLEIYERRGSWNPHDHKSAVPAGQ